MLNWKPSVRILRSLLKIVSSPIVLLGPLMVLHGPLMGPFWRVILHIISSLAMTFEIIALHVAFRVSSTIQAHKSISWYLDVDMVCIIPSWQLWLESFEGRVSTPQKTTTFIHYNCIIQMHLHKQYRESRLQASLHTPLLIMCLLDIDEGSSFVDRLSPEKDFSSKSASILKSALTYTLCEL